MVLYIAIHLLVQWCGKLSGKVRGWILSAGGGISLAYIFLHVLPDIGHYHQRYTGHFLFMYMMAGFLFFYVFERIVRHSGKEDLTIKQQVFWAHTVAFALYNVVIAILLINRSDKDLPNLILFGIALGLHLFTTGFGLWHEYRQQFVKFARWILAAATITGALLGYFLPLTELARGYLFAFVAGSTILIVIKDELPENPENENSIVAFFISLLGYSAIVYAVEMA